MTETTRRTGPGPAKQHAIRMYGDAWDKMEAREHGTGDDPSKFTRDMTEAGLGYARCRRCMELVPVEFGDLTGKSLIEWIAEAVKAVTAQHRHGHHPVTIGNEAGTESPRRPVASPVFREP